MQRLRLKFGRGEQTKYLSHLDMMRLWERAMRRARLALAYSEGFTPHPRISLAAPLPVGITSEAELMDVFLTRWVPPDSFTAQTKQQLPESINLLEAWVIGLNTPSLQAKVRFAEYKVEVETEIEMQGMELALQSLLSATHLPWHHSRDTGVRHYDLRALVDDLWIIDHHDPLYTLGMRLRCDTSGSGRPEQVLLAMGFHQRPKTIHRTNLILS